MHLSCRLRISTEADIWAWDSNGNLTALTQEFELIEARRVMLSRAMLRPLAAANAIRRGSARCALINTG